MIEIKDIQGSVIYSTGINKGAKRKFQLMKEDYITLPFSVEAPLDFGLGSNVEIDGIRYEITTRQNPTYNKTTGGYDYNLRFDAYYWKWKNKIFKFTPQNGGQEASWSLTAQLSVYLDVFIENLNALGYLYKGQHFTYSIDASLNGKNLVMTYSSTSLIDALSAMAEQLECDWWIEGNVINFGRCETGEYLDLAIGDNLAEIQSSASQISGATRLYVFGSTRNLPSDYASNNSSISYGIAEKRLTLPDGVPYIDVYEGQEEEEAIEEVVVLEDVYPKTTGLVSAIETYEDSVKNDDGITTTETFYRFRDNGIIFSEKYVLEGEELKAVFTSGLLNGMEFGIRFNPEGKPEKIEKEEPEVKPIDNGESEDSEAEMVLNPEAQLFEIVANDTYGRKLPDNTLRPSVGDTYILIGWDTSAISDLGLVAKAEAELLEEGRKIADKRRVDPNTYNCKVDSQYVFELGGYEDEENSHFPFELGRRVNIVSNDNAGGVESRIVGYEYNLDYPYDTPTLIIGETASYSRIGALESKVDSMSLYGTGNKAEVSSNLYLRKDRSDRSKGTISSDKGFEVGRYKEGELGSGGIFKLDKDKNSYLEVDKMLVRKIAYFVEIMIKKLSHVGGSIILSPASMKCSKVEEYETYYRCFFENEQEGKTINQEFVVGDQARSQEFNIKEGLSHNVRNQYYWRLVVGVGSNYIDLSKADCDSGSGIPLAGDDIVQLGNRNNPERQNAIILSSYGEGTPSFRQYKKIHTYSMSDAELVTEFSPESNLITGKFISKSGKDLEEELLEAKVDWDKVLEQTDKEFSMWFFPYAPSADVVPEVDWVTPELKALHEEDLFYDKSTGLAWRYTYENGYYFWEIVTDAETIKALEKASKAQETADEKIRNFGAQPIPPYDKGDRWCNATYGDLFDDDDLVCVTSKEKGEEFSIEDWRPVSYGKTSIIKNMEGEIKLLADSFELGADGKYYLSKEAGVNITTEMASLYATKTEYNTLASKVSSNSSQINATANSLSAFTEKISFNSSGDITNISKSGLVTTSNYTSIFSQYKSQTGAVVQSEISAFVTEREVGDMISNIEITADKIKLEGVTTINGSFSVDTDGTTHIGGFTVENGILSSNGDYKLKIDPVTDDPGVFITYLGKVYAAIRVSELNPKSGQLETYGASGSVCILNGGYAKFNNASGTTGLIIDGDSINGPHLEIRKGNYFLWIGIDENGMAEISSNCWPYYDDDTTRKQGTLAWDNSRYGKFK
jgi:hypothetical protein